MDNKTKLKIKMAGYMTGVMRKGKSPFALEGLISEEATKIYSDGFALGELDIKKRLEEFMKEFK